MQRTLSAAECSTSGSARIAQPAARPLAAQPRPAGQVCHASAASARQQASSRTCSVQTRAVVAAEYGQDMSVAEDSYVVLVRT